MPLVTRNPSRASEFTRGLVEQELLNRPEHLSSVFSEVRSTRSLVLCVCLVDRRLSFFYWSLCCLMCFFDLPILITPLVSLNCSYITNIIIHSNPSSQVTIGILLSPVYFVISYVFCYLLCILVSTVYFAISCVFWYLLCILVSTVYFAISCVFCYLLCILLSPVYFVIYCVFCYLLCILLSNASCGLNQISTFLFFYYCMVYSV